MEYLPLVFIIPFFLWMLRESDYLRARLLVGAEICLPRYERKTWGELKTEANTLPDKYKPFWLKYPEHMHPLCGLDWIQNTMHVIPDYQIEMSTCGIRYRMHIKEAGILPKVMKANKVTKAQKLAYARS